MKVSFLGAAGTVTGSCYMIETAGRRFCIDCGLHQGNRTIEARNRDEKPYEPKGLGFVLLTHAHMDHSGLLPKLVREGFSGPIYCTEPTADLLEVMLDDSAHIQEMEAEWQSRKAVRKGHDPVEPLYGEEHVPPTLELLSTVRYDETFEPLPGITVRYRDAGHILGSAFIEIEVRENADTYTLTFSGDLGQPDQLIVSDPQRGGAADYLFMESTYGDRDHKDKERSVREFRDAILATYERGGNVIIPAFAVERTQEVLYSLHCMHADGELPKDMAVFLDSPLAIKATNIFRKHPEYMDADARALFDAGSDPFHVPQLKMTPSVAESRAINDHDGPAIIVSASGMCNAGRVLHHLRHNLWRPEAAIIFVGYQGQGTTGRKIVDGVGRVRVHGEHVAVKAKVHTIGGFSSHAGQTEMLEWLSHFSNPQMQVVLLHGELEAQLTFQQKIAERFGFAVHIPEYLETMELAPGTVSIDTSRSREAKAIDWDYLFKDTDGLYAELKERVQATDDASFARQAEAREKLLEVNRALLQAVSEL